MKLNVDKNFKTEDYVISSDKVYEAIMSFYIEDTE